MKYLIPQYPRTSYFKTKTRKACQIIPKIDFSSNIRKCIIICEYDDDEGKETEIISFDGHGIVPVTTKDSRNRMVEKGYYLSISLDEEGREVREKVDGIKFYVDNEIFHKIISTFGQKQEK